MRRYIVHKKPKPKEWLGLSESARINLVEKAHVADGYEGSSIRVHAAIHVVVENQLALDIPEAVAAFQRLRLDGLDRHECIHAIGSVLAECIYNSGAISDDGYLRKLQELTATGWIEKYKDD